MKQLALWGLFTGLTPYDVVREPGNHHPARLPDTRANPGDRVPPRAEAGMGTSAPPRVKGSGSPRSSS